MSQEQHKRSIKSFVCRNIKLPASKERLFKTLWPLYGVEEWRQLSLGSLSASSLFSTPSPIVLEIGFGTGQTLFEMAQNYPDQNFIGIEVYRSGIANVLANLERQPLLNLKLFFGDATEILERFMGATIDRIQVFFPDPWPKSRHRKRRLIQSPLVSMLKEKLKVHGILHLATDWEDYAMQMMQVMMADPHYANIQGGQSFAERPDYRSLTKYERRGVRLGHGTWDLMFKRLA